MKIYYFPIAPNPTRLMVFVKEKGIDIELTQVNLREGEQKSPQHLARNPRGSLPVLELDDGSFVTESLPIMEYLEECYPQPSMIGTNPEQRLKTREAERLAESLVLNPMGRYVHATNSPLRLPANPEVARVERERFEVGLNLFNDTLARQAFCCGEAVSIADCTLFAGLQFAEFFGFPVPDQYPTLRKWYEGFKQRPSTQL